MKYFMFLFFMLLIGAILPSSFFVVAPFMENVRFTFSYIDANAMRGGLLYTLIASILMVIAALLFSPSKPTETQQINNHLTFGSYKNILFCAGVVGLIIQIILNSLMGMSPSNIIAQRPQWAVYLGYLSATLYLAAIAFICSELRLYCAFRKKSMFLVFLLCLGAALAWSRSALIYFAFIVICSIAYSPKQKSIRNILRLKVVVLLVFVLVFTILGQMKRNKFDKRTLTNFVPEMSARLFANNEALFLGFVNFEKINKILLEGQPNILFQQLFSFILPRTEYPSSFRYKEFWGAQVVADERGHIPAYAYGWLGLTYGLLGWYGLLLVFLVFVFFFISFRVLSKKRMTLFNSLFFAYLVIFLIEFFMNLGLDSYIEKVFKGVPYLLFLYLIITVFNLKRNKSSCRKVSANSGLVVSMPD